jgi:hypothetical protein
MFKETKPEPHRGVTIDAAKIAALTNEELERAGSNLDRMIAAIS